MNRLAEFAGSKLEETWCADPRNCRGRRRARWQKTGAVSPSSRLNFFARVVDRLAIGLANRRQPSGRRCAFASGFTLSSSTMGRIESRTSSKDFGVSGFVVENLDDVEAVLRLDQVGNATLR